MSSEGATFWHRQPSSWNTRGFYHPHKSGLPLFQSVALAIFRQASIIEPKELNGEMSSNYPQERFLKFGT